jgi:hypothetical protein
LFLNWRLPIRIFLFSYSKSSPCCTGGDFLLSDHAVQASKTGFFGLKCGFQHSNPAVVGRKSGLQKMPDDDFCMAAGGFHRIFQCQLLKSSPLKKIRRIFTFLIQSSHLQ